MTRVDDPEPPLSKSWWNALRDDELDRDAMASAYLRFTMPRRVRSMRANLAGWFTAGVVGAWAVVAFATGDPLLGAGRYRALTERPPTASAPAPTIRRSRGTLPGGPTTPTPAAAEPLVPIPELPAPSKPTPSAPLAASVSTPAAAAAVDAHWQRVAVALKAHDYPAAEAGLRELEGAAMPATREAASFSLAQVLLSRGRRVEARSRLERLRASASTSSVQRKAESLLLELDTPAERSSTGPAATH